MPSFTYFLELAASSGGYKHPIVGILHDRLASNAFAFSCYHGSEGGLTAGFPKIQLTVRSLAGLRFPPPLPAVTPHRTAPVPHPLLSAS